MQKVNKNKHDLISLFSLILSVQYTFTKYEF